MLERAKDWLLRLFSESDGTPSSSRTLMYLFAFFSMWIIGRIVNHVLHLTDAAVIGLWLANFPLIIAALMGLIVLPYTINQGKAGLADIAAMITAAKEKKAEG